MMKRLLLVVLMSMASFGAAHSQTPDSFETMTIEQLQAQAPTMHPVALYVLAGRLLVEGRGQEAANWMYAGQLRYRFMLLAKGDERGDDAILFGAITEQIGRPVNEYIAGDVDDWIAAMDWALDWDATTPNPTTSKTEFAAELAEVRDGLESLRAYTDLHRKAIIKQRAANGLENR